MQHSDDRLLTSAISLLVRLPRCCCPEEISAVSPENHTSASAWSLQIYDQIIKSDQGLINH